MQTRTWLSLGALLTPLALGAACAPVDAEADADASNVGGDEVVEAPPEASLLPPASGLTSDFRSWLQANGYDAAGLARDDLDGGSFGGRAFAGEALVNQPVIFIHGNGDKAAGDSFGQTGWSASYDYFTRNGYKPAELYATTWGPADAFQSSQQYHSKAHVMQVRRFIEAVKAYTGASKVDIVAHSMGVTLARKAVKGGSANDALAGGSYNVGPSLKTSVDAFVGIAGANLGLVNCYLSGPTTPTCGSTNGLYPGQLFGFFITGRSAFLNDLLASSGYEGSFRYSMWSTVDELIGFGNLVYGEATSRLPGQTGEVVFSSVPYGHFGLKDKTADRQLALVKHHRTN
ncbi:MAG: lipase family protein [Polyangiaceae bacterium]|nr:lipase family protein [Polyangiaceae bacterium]